MYLASGDLRNMVKTVISLPSTYTNRCTIVLNDMDRYVVARNAILLILALILDPHEAPEILLHVWYSARLTPRIAMILQEKVKPMVLDVLQKIRYKSDSTILAKTWSSRRVSISVRFYKSQWMFLLKMLEAEMTLEKAESERKYIMLHKDRLDFRERNWFNFYPGSRWCANKLLETGVLLPVGHCNDDFTVPNV